MTADWNPSLDEVAAMREARRNGTLRQILRDGIAEGRARLEATPTPRWTSGQRRDIGGTTCPLCKAGPDQRCHLRTRAKTHQQPHEERIAAWAQAVACCPTCQAAPGQKCHLDGMALPTNNIHPARHQEAEATAA
ncbi:zinc finger domain-containing protein [Streptomyces sp. NPDC002755]